MRISRVFHRLHLNSKKVFHESHSRRVFGHYSMPAIGRFATNEEVWWKIGSASLILGVLMSNENLQTHLKEAPLGRNFIADAVEKAAPSVVNITIQYGHQFPSSSGSGFIIASTGLIVTNAHVVAKVSRHASIMVTLANGVQYSAHVHSTDSASDIALLQLDGSPMDLPTMQIGSSAELRAGEWVVALGSPLSLQNSVSAGIVSATARHSSELGFSQRNNKAEYIQTDAAINVGNSGGPLVNLDGKVIGINAMKIAGGITGISFAIPIDTAMEVVSQLRKNKSVMRPYVGMQMVEFNAKVLPNISTLYPGITQGVVVKSVTRDSPAASAGIQPGDVIVEFAGTKVFAMKDVISALGFNVNRKMCMKILRDGKTDPLTLCFITKDASTQYTSSQRFW